MTIFSAEAKKDRRSEQVCGQNFRSSVSRRSGRNLAPEEGHISSVHLPHGHGKMQGKLGAVINRLCSQEEETSLGKSFPR